jgi:glycogen(starch) synthase
MRVLFFSGLFPPYVGGIEILSGRLTTELAARGHDITVVTSRDDLGLPAEEERSGVRIVRLPVHEPLRQGDVGAVMSARRRVAEIKRNLDPELVHVNGIGPSAFLHASTLDACSAPILTTLHQQLFVGEGAGAESLTERILRSSAWVTSVSELSLSQARRLCPEIVPRSSVIYNGCEVPAGAPSPPPAEPRLLCLGRLVPQKGFDLALEAFARVERRFPVARLIVAGDGVERPALQALSARLGIADRVEFRGLVAHHAVGALIDSCTALLMPSRFEGLPLVAIEAALRARPVIAARVGGLPEIVDDGRSGLLVPPENAAALTAALASVLGGHFPLEEMGRAARRRAGELFSWERCVRQYDDCYRSLGGSPR